MLTTSSEFFEDFDKYFELTLAVFEVEVARLSVLREEIILTALFSILLEDQRDELIEEDSAERRPTFSFLVTGSYIDFDRGS